MFGGHRHELRRGFAFCTNPSARRTLPKPLTTAICLLLCASVSALAQTDNAYQPTPEANAIVAKASQLFDAGKIDESIAVLDQGIQAHARDPRFHAMKGMAFERQDKFGKAVESYNVTLRMDPDYHQARDRRMFISSVAGRPGSGINNRDTWNQRGVDDASYLIKQGKAYHQQRGTFHLRLGNAAAALADYSKAKDNLSPPVPPKRMLELLIMRAQASQQLNLWDYAMWDLEKSQLILEKTKAQFTDDEYKNETMRLQDGLAKATSALKAARSGSNTGDFGELLKNNNNEQRIKQVSEWVARAPTDAIARYFRGKNLYRAGALEIAQMELEKAVELGLDQPGTRAELFVLHSTRGPFEKAIEDANFEIDRGNKDPGSWVQRGMVYDKLNRFKESAADYQYAIAHLETDSPKDLDPKFVQQRLQIAHGGLAAAEKKIMVSKIFAAVAAEDPQSLLPAIHPALRPIIDMDELKKRFAIVNRRFGRITGIDWDNFEYSGDTGFLVIECVVLFERGQAQTRLFGGESGAFIGFRMSGDLFQLDTRTAVKGFEKYEQEASEFFRLLLTQQVDKAHKLFDPEAHNPETAAKFATNMRSLTEVISKLEFDRMSPLMTKIEQPSKDAPTAITVYADGAFKDGGHISTRMKFVPAKDGNFVSATFNAGGFSETVTTENIELAENIFRALGNRDTEKMLELLDANTRPQLRPDVLRTFVETVGAAVGPFQSIDRSRFASTTQFEATRRHTTHNGYVKFSKTECGGKCAVTFGQVESFSLSFPGGLKWAKNIKDTSEFRKLAEEFLTQTLSGELSTGYGMLPAGFRNQMPIAKLQRIRTLALAEAKGKVVGVDFLKQTYNEQQDGWRFHFRINGEGAQFDGYVDYVFNAFNGKISGFNFAID